MSCSIIESLYRTWLGHSKLFVPCTISIGLMSMCEMTTLVPTEFIRWIALFCAGT